MSDTRRAFLRTAAGAALALQGLGVLSACAPGAPVRGDGGRPDFPPLEPDPAGWLDLPKGFSCTRISKAGDVMSDGLFEPDAHDGMAAFPVAGDSDRCILVRNHEIGASRSRGGAFGDNFERAGSLSAAQIYDRTAGGRPLLGGTTTVLVNLRTGRLERSHLSLAGTATNCAGGATPWGSWLSCEETVERAGDNAQRDHGFVFEVPSQAPGLVAPVPLKGMGRFVHEAAAVDPETGIVYLSEDDQEGLFYRYLPKTRGELQRGGRLQALALREQAGADTRNGSGGLAIEQGRSLIVDWVDLDEVEAPDGDLRFRGRKAGAAIFARGEGLTLAMEAGRPTVYLVSTSGGPARLGQIWRYRPSRFEGRAEERAEPGVLSLFVEGRSASEFEMIDNICASPHGFLVTAEDGREDNFLRLVTPGGRVFPLARNAHPDRSELCGPCFSPDGSVLFVNVQKPGVTLAIRGPWGSLVRAV